MTVIDSGPPIEWEDWDYARANSGRLSHMLLIGVDVRDKNLRDAGQSMLEVLYMAEQMLGKTPVTVEPGNLTFTGRNGDAALWMGRAFRWRSTGKFGCSDAMLVLRSVRHILDRYGILPILEKEEEAWPDPEPEPIKEMLTAISEDDIADVLGFDFEEEDDGRPKSKKKRR